MSALDAIDFETTPLTDLVEICFERGWTDGLPVVPPTHEKKVDAMVGALGGEPDMVECKVAPRWDILYLAMSRNHCAESLKEARCHTQAIKIAVPFASNEISQEIG
jgi:hypothetical protein